MRHALATLATITFAVLAPGSAFGFGQPEHSGLEFKAQEKAGETQLEFKVVPKANMMVNFDAPWKLEIKSQSGVALSKTLFERGDMNDSLPGFVLKGKTDKPAGEIEYSATVFVCTKDKTQCFREVHKGKETWAAK